MSEVLLKELRELEFDSLTSKEAVALRSALAEAVGKADAWFASLAANFAQPLKDRPVEKAIPVKTVLVEKTLAPRRRGRPVPALKVDYPRRKPAPEPIAVGGADAPGEGPQAARIFQESYMSKDGPRPGASLPADHPRNFARPSSVTPEVDMGDFHEVEAAMQKGQLNKLFQS